MRISFTAAAWNDYRSWGDDRRGRRKINSLIKDITRTPYSGIGKPEELKMDLQGVWSRRITQEHRLVYVVRGETLVVLSCRDHYKTNSYYLGKCTNPPSEHRREGDGKRV
jgi:toxin YoeB